MLDMCVLCFVANVLLTFLFGTDNEECDFGTRGSKEWIGMLSSIQWRTSTSILGLHMGCWEDSCRVAGILLWISPPLVFGISQPVQSQAMIWKAALWGEEQSWNIKTSSRKLIQKNMRMWRRIHRKNMVNIIKQGHNAYSNTAADPGANKLPLDLLTENEPIDR